jgi:protein CpxP
MKKILFVFCLLLGITAAGHAQVKSTMTSDPVEKAKGLQKKLKLTDDQTAKVAAIYKESAKKYDKIKADEHGDTNKMLVAIGPLRKETIKKIKAVLTPSQAVKYDNLVNKSNSAGNYGWGDGWSASATS